MSEVIEDYPMPRSADRERPSLRCALVAILCSLAIVVIGILAILLGAARVASGPDAGYAKKSPFAAVRWEEAQPEVQVGGDWFRLLSLDDIPASEIVAFSQQMYENLWQKRFEEDLVELLTQMGHPPRDKVTLVVQSLTSGETRIFGAVPMTAANRRAIRDAAQKRTGRI